MLKRERRVAPRMAVNGQAYVNLDHNNGGIILNISEGGLCFQSSAPMQRTDSIRLWFSYRRVDPDAGLAWQAEAPPRGISRFIEVGSQLAWVDSTQKRGGLRFTNLRPEAREQIRDWISQPSVGKLTSKGAASSPAAQRAHIQTLGKAFAKLKGLVGWIQSRRVWKGFSGGLVTGVVASALVAGVFGLLSHNRVLGNSLVEFGERLGGTSAAQQQITGPPPGAMEDPSSRLESQAPLAKAVAARVEPETTAMPTAPPQKPQSTDPLPNESLHTGEPATASSAPRSVFSFPASAPRLHSTPAEPSLPGIMVAAAPESGATLFRVMGPEFERAGRPTVYIEPSGVEALVARSEKYLEVGKFKEKLLADRTTGQLSQQGFSTAVVSRNRFLGKVYQVLVGPYRDDAEAEAAHKDLASLGFTPRSYERGKRDLNLPAGLRVGGKSVPVGYCVISWESYIPDAIVKFEDVRGMGPTLEAKWVKQSLKYEKNAIAYQNNRDGSRTLLELRFAGMAQTLVFATENN